jgi:hypothetical protein
MVRPFFEQTEGFALSMLDSLATGRRPHPLPSDKRLERSEPEEAKRSGARASGAVAGLEPTEELIRIGSHRLNLHLHRHLLQSGGHRERTVLREGRRVSGRLWDAALNDSFRLRFTEASRNLWLGMVQVVLRPPKSWDPQQVGRHARVEGTESGDWLFYARVHANAHKSGIEFRPDDYFGRRLRNASPLVVLFSLEPHLMQRLATRNHLSRLLQKGSVRMIECLDDALLPSWIEIIRASYQRSGSLAAFTVRFEGIAEVLDAWVDVLDEKQRLDLATVAMRAAAALVTELLPENPMQDVGARYPPRNVHERQSSHQALARVAAVGVRLEQLRDRFALLRYGDERWDEGQLYLAAFDDLLAPHVERLRALERGLRGIIG